MNNIILISLNLKPDDIESITPIYLENSTDYEIVLKKNEHPCPRCGVFTSTVKDYTVKKIHHKIFKSTNTVIHYKQRRFKCKDCGRTFMEINPFGNSKSNISPATVANILDDLKPYNSTFSSVARDYGLSVQTIVNIFDRHVRVKRKTLPAVMCVDEFYFNRKARYKYPFMIMNFENNLIIDIVESRRSEILTDYLFNIPVEERNKVRYICMDLYDPYRRTSMIFFKNAQICADQFHLIKLINDKLNNIRKNVMRKYAKDKRFGKKSVEYKLLKYRYKLILKSYKDLDCEKYYLDRTLGYHTTERNVADIILELDPKLKLAHKLKENYLEFNDEEEDSFPGIDFKEKELNKIIKDYHESDIWDFKHCAGTLSNWKQEILNSFIWIDGRRISNGPIEGKNTYIKKILSNANGFINFTRARNKLLYSQNKYEKYDYYEHKDSIQMKKNKN